MGRSNGGARKVAAIEGLFENCDRDVVNGTEAFPVGGERVVEAAADVEAYAASDGVAVGGPITQSGRAFGKPARIVSDLLGIQPVIPAFGVIRDGLWPRSAVAWIVLSVILIVASVQLVTPTRRWRLRRRGLRVALGRSA